MAITKQKGTEKIAPGIRDFAALLTPVVTEKSALVGGSGNRVVFRVRRDANKADIKQAVERIYKVDVTSVRTCNFFGKGKRTAKGMGYRSGYRKAYVTIKDGQSIDIVEGL